MLYRELVDVYKRLEATTKKLEKVDILSRFFSKVKKEDLANVVLLSAGIVFPKVEQKDLGIALEMMKRIVQKVAGVDKAEFNKIYKKTGDMGFTAKELIKNKKQRSLGKKELTVEMVVTNLRKLPAIEGCGSQERKISLVSELLSNANPDEAMYLVRTILGEMRIGVAEGIIRDSIAKAFDVSPEDVEHAYNLLNDYGMVAEMAADKKLSGLAVKIGKPIRVMLAEKAPDLKTALESFKNPALEIKLDGFRVQIHKKGKKIWIFSRRMDDVTKQFPEVVKWAREAIKTDVCIVEGETIAVDLKTGKPLPFQHLSRRIQRKYDIEKMVREIPAQVNLFELIYIGNKNYMNEPLRKRWSKLRSIVKEIKGKFVLVEHIETNDYNEAEKFYKRSLSMGEEGVMVKNLDAVYQPGKRVGYWLKVKPIMEPLDLVIIGAEWGTGKRAGWFGSFLLGARNEDKFVPVGKLGTGLSDKEFKTMTKKLKKLIIEEKGRNVKFRPEVVIEVAYEEIQKSPNYESGFALRFPRMLRIRDPEDKGPGDADTIARIKKLYNQQKGRQSKERGSQAK
ncbi:MAG: DNA ligase [Candidatus Aenigmarchaeota archaeon ex4484_14]|nr:MAG: DNA ligase [Candidatus Aenigmarchaeota archaeon ex4484_14]